MGVLYIISNWESSATAFEMASKESTDVTLLLIGRACELVEKNGLIGAHDFSGVFCLDDGVQKLKNFNGDG